MKDKEDNIISHLIKIGIPLIVIIGLLIGAVTTGVITIQPYGNTTNINKPANPSLENATSITLVTADIIIDFGDETKITNTITSKNATVYGFLLEAAEINDFNVKATYYSQLDSIFVDAISTYENGQDNRYWIYYINGETGMVGADKQPVNNGDLIEWKFEKYQ